VAISLLRDRVNQGRETGAFPRFPVLLASTRLIFGPVYYSVALTTVRRGREWLTLYHRSFLPGVSAAQTNNDILARRRSGFTRSISAVFRHRMSSYSMRLSSSPALGNERPLGHTPMHGELSHCGVGLFSYRPIPHHRLYLSLPSFHPLSKAEGSNLYAVHQPNFAKKSGKNLSVTGIRVEGLECHQ